MSNCLPCSDPIAPCQGCTKSQVCYQAARSCTQCPRNICVDSSPSSSKNSGPSTGTTAGAAVGGVVGVAVMIAAVWWFWWRPRGLEASRKRYSKHMLNRQSKLAEKRKTGSGLDGAATDVATKRTSVHLRMDEPSSTNNRRSAATGNLLDDADETMPVSRTSEDDNPFGDQNRSSIGTFDVANDGASTHTSEFSFRSSHSTNIIPIAYIPPHSSSVSIDDAAGRTQQLHNASPRGAAPGSAGPPRRSSMLRASIPTSMASRDSLALAGAETIELNPLPPVLTPDTPSIPHGTMANGAPIRPPRSPGLDLQLPKTSSPLASPPINSPHLTQRMSAGYPFSNATSGSPTSPTSPHNQLFPPPVSGAPRGMSFLAEPHRSGSSQSHMSVMSSFTSRSANSTMSYILDPPQIITPVNAQGVRRVEFQQAKAHKLGTAGPAGASHSPTSPLATLDPFSDAAAESRETGSTSRPVSGSSRWTSSSLASDASEAVQFLKGQAITFTNPNTPLPTSATTISPSAVRGSSTLSVDMPRSARSSQSYSIVDGNRQSTWSASSGPASSADELGSHNMSRTSTTSSTSHDSLLAGIPFMAPAPLPLPHGPSTSSINLSLPINVTTPFESPASRNLSSFPPPPARVPSPNPSTAETTTTRGSIAASAATGEELDDDDALPAPYLPFAGQRPTATSPTKETNPRVQSEHFSVRSGFGSGLSQIPFQLGFPSGLGEGEEGSERGSMISTGAERWSGQGDMSLGQQAHLDEDEDAHGPDHESALSRVEEQTEIGTDESATPSRRESVKSAAETQVAALPTPPASPRDVRRTLVSTTGNEPDLNPFGAHAEVDRSDPRASMDTLALSAALSANLDADQ
ncbi:uncharacterized protein JCM15063_005190 [Sporobolomyces koalae]|uniref:uncharacterized protein n=1 Tax=Sporobolomyces koalae TaxID=500713 RepID=UPI0031764321